MVHQPFFIPAALFIALSLPLILGVMPRNRLYGIRSRKALESDAVWYPVNRFGGVALSLAAVVYLVYARLAPASDGVVGFDLFHPHFYAFAVPLVLAFVATRMYSSRF